MNRTWYEEWRRPVWRYDYGRKVYLYRPISPFDTIHFISLWFSSYFCPVLYGGATPHTLPAWSRTPHGCLCHWQYHPDDSHMDIISPDLLQVRNLGMLIYFSCRVSLALGTITQRKFVLFWKNSTVNLDRSPSSSDPRERLLKAWLSPQPSWLLPLDLCPQWNY